MIRKQLRFQLKLIMKWKIILTAWMLYSEVEQDLMADGTSADFGRYAAAALAGTPAATESAAQCAATTAALSTL